MNNRFAQPLSASDPHFPFLPQSRRRQLKAVIKQARLATRGASQSIRHLSSSKRHKLKQAREQLKVFPGFTVLVFDTNVLLSSMKLLRDLVEAECWTIIVPLAGKLLCVAYSSHLF